MLVTRHGARSAPGTGEWSWFLPVSHGMERWRNRKLAAPAPQPCAHPFFSSGILYRIVRKYQCHFLKTPTARIEQPAHPRRGPAATRRNVALDTSGRPAGRQRRHSQRGPPPGAMHGTADVDRSVRARGPARARTPIHGQSATAENVSLMCATQAGMQQPAGQEAAAAPALRAGPEGGRDAAALCPHSGGQALTVSAAHT